MIQKNLKKINVSTLAGCSRHADSEKRDIDDRIDKDDFGGLGTVR